jgi:hypothetical protein
VARFDPSPREISAIEQIETVFNDTAMEEDRRVKLMRKLWAQLERVHGSRVLMLQSPEGQVIQSPFARG